MGGTGVGIDDDDCNWCDGCCGREFALMILLSRGGNMVDGRIQYWLDWYM